MLFVSFKFSLYLTSSVAKLIKGIVLLCGVFFFFFFFFFLLILLFQFFYYCPMYGNIIGLFSILQFFFII